VWLTVLTPGSAGADVRGRQLAWLLAVAPYAVVSTVLLTAIDGQSQYWPWAISLLAALLGGGAGVLAYGSLVFVQPLDESGGPTPAWSLKVHAALVAVALTAAPPLVLLLVGWHWVAVPVGVLTGVGFATGLGRRATVRLARGQVGLLATLA
jgi:ABC-2 type transport system permease protein